MFLRQVDYARWKTGNIDQNLQQNNVARQVEVFVSRISLPLISSQTVVVCSQKQRRKKKWYWKRKKQSDEPGVFFYLYVVFYKKDLIWVTIVTKNSIAPLRGKQALISPKRFELSPSCLRAENGRLRTCKKNCESGKEFVKFCRVQKSMRGKWRGT